MPEASENPAVVVFLWGSEPHVRVGGKKRANVNISTELARLKIEGREGCAGPSLLNHCLDRKALYFRITFLLASISEIRDALNSEGVFPTTSYPLVRAKPAT